MSAGAAARPPAARRWTALVAPGLATLLVGALLVGLGVWQLRRLAWKEALIAAVERRTAAAPVPLPPRAAWAGLDSADYEYRRVSLTGTFDHADEVHVYRPLASPRGPHGGVGDVVLTPFRLAGGGTVIVDRGFVPEGRVDPATRPAGQVAGEVTITGLMRAPQTRNAFTPADDPAADQWFTADPAAVAAHLGIADAAPFLVDEDAGQAPGGLPQGGETVVTFPNDHLQYALTWFGLAAGLAGVFAAWAWRLLRGGGRRSAEQPLHPQEVEPAAELAGGLRHQPDAREAEPLVQRDRG